MTIKNLKVVVLFFVIFLFIIHLQIATKAQNEESTDTILAVSDRTAAVRDAIVAAVPGVTDAANVTDTNLAAITYLNLRNKNITSLKSGDFSGMTGLTDLNLYGNQLSSLPNGIFSGLTALTTLRLSKNRVSPLPLAVSLAKVGENQFKADVPSGAPFTIVLPVSVTNGSIAGDVPTLSIAKGSIESDAVTVTRTEGTTDAVTVNIGTVPSLPTNHYGYALSKSDVLPIEVISVVSTSTDIESPPETETQDPPTPPIVSEVSENNAPSFSDGTITLRSIAENTAADTNIGTAVAATDEDSDDTLTYTLGGRDADSFAIESTTGQLKTKAALDYETKRVYLVSITVSDTTDSDTISVVINIIDVADTTISTAALGVSDRTPQVRDAIVAAVPNVSNAADVTAANLSEIGTLNLRNSGITSLQAGDFSGLTNLRALNLYGNNLSALPDGIFNGLTSLTSLRLGGNSVDPLPIIVSIEQVSSNQYRVVIPTGAPFDVSVPLLHTDGDSTNQSLGAVTVSKGNIRSDTQTVVSVNGMYVDIGSLPTLPINHFGYTLSKSVTCNVTQEVADAIADAIEGVENCRNVSAVQLATITSLDLRNDSITSLQDTDFAGMLALSTLNLEDNQLSNLPDGIFSGLTSLTTLQLNGNTGAPFSFEVLLEKVGTNQFKAVMPTGAPFDVVLPITVAKGSAADNASSVSISTGSTESDVLTVTRTALTIEAVTVDIGTLPSIPTSHNGYALSKSDDLPLTIFAAINVAPVLTEGTAATRSIAENTASGTNIGTPIAATDRNSGDTLVYSLGGTDAASFAIVASTGQLQTQAALDYETKNSYTVIVNVTDGELSDTITVTINISDVDENVAPEFTDGASTTRSIAENTASGTNIGTPVAATDRNSGDTLVYSLSGTDAASFAIVASTGQLQTKAALDYETKNSYAVIVNVTDGKLSDTIAVTINISDVDENVAPVFTDGASTTRSVAENTAAGTNIGTPVAATDRNSGDTLVYSLSGTDAASFDIVASTGQLQTKTALNYERKNSYSVSVSVSDGNGGSDSINVTINVTDVKNEGTQQQQVERNIPNTPTNNAPSFTDGDSTTRSIAENSVSGTNIGTPIAATDQDTTDTLSYTLGGTDASSFTIVGTTGQLRTDASLDYETKNSYTVTVSVSDGKGGTDSISVTINVTDVTDETTQQPVSTNNAPSFTDGDSTTRSIAENSVSGTNIGTPIAATDQDTTDTLSYTLGGTDASSFTIVGTTGQLRTDASLDYETKNSYTITVSVSDGNGGTDSISVTINVTDVTDETTQQPVSTNNVPTFTDGDSTTRSIAENSVSGTNIGAAVSATDADTSNEIPDVLSYTLGGTDASSFSIDSTTGQLQTKDALDYETKNSYTVTVSVSDSKGGTDSISVTINVTDVTEVTGPNVAPIFTEGDSTRRFIETQPNAGANVGEPITATDANGDSLTYTLSGTHAGRFHINSNTGQLTIAQGGNGFSYYIDSFRQSSVTVSVSDSKGGSDSIGVTVYLSVGGVHAFNNNTPVFVDIFEGEQFPEPLYTFAQIGESVRSFDIPEDTSIGTVVAELNTIDEDRSHQHWLRDSLSGADASSFSTRQQDVLDFTLILIGGPIIGYSYSEITTNTTFDYETKQNYSVSLTVSDLEGATDTIALNFNITDVDESPIFSDGSSTARSISENVASGTSVGSAVSATDPEGKALTYTLGGTDVSSFNISSTTGQITTSGALDFETKPSYAVTVTASDGTNSSTISVTINVTDLNEAVTQNPPVFTEGTSTTRSIAENVSSGTNIGSAVSATDSDPGSTLAYSLSGTDASTFSVVSSSGQLQTSGALDHESQDSYTVTVNVTDGSLTDSIIVTINVTDANDAPTFDDGPTTTRTVLEEVRIGTNVGDPVLASDQDKDTLTYSLSGTDAASFTVDSSTAQIKTAVEIDFETKSTYTVVVTVRDNETGTDADTDTPLSDTITVTINIRKNVFNQGQPPTFEQVFNVSRTIAENSPAGTNIGAPITATDADSDELTYSLGEGGDNDAFDIVSSTGQIQVKDNLNYEVDNSYSVQITVTDGVNRSTTGVRINVTDANDAPVFTDGTSKTLSIAENTAADTNIGAAVGATDEDEDDEGNQKDTLTYTLGGDDAASFDVVSTSGQIKTKAELDYETKNSFSVTLTVSDGNQGTDSIAVTINVTDVTEAANEPPEFSDGPSATRSIPENTAVGSNVGAAFTATDPDNGDTVTYSLSGTDASSFSVGRSTGQLTTATTFDYETKTSYTVIITASDGKPNNGKDTITVTINITNVTENNVPVFTDGDSTTRSVDEESYATQTAPWVNIGDPIVATDGDNDTLTYAITGSPSGFQILSTGQLQGKSLDHESAASHSLTITVTDTNAGSDSISVTVTVNDINEIPTISSDNDSTLGFDAGTAANTNLGSIYTAYDYDDSDTITFSLAGTDSDKFELTTTTTATYSGSDGYAVQATAQLKNREELTIGSFSVEIEATDTAQLKATTSVTINVAAAPDPVVSSRTQAVQDAIIDSIDGVTSATDVTGTHLAAITSLDLSNQSISSLSTGDFNGMSSLTSLDLSNNLLSTDLPDGIFSGLTLSTLDLSNNTGNPTIILSIEMVDDGDNDKNTATYRVKANTAAPFDLTLNMSLTLCCISDITLPFGFQSVSISAGSTYSNNGLVTRNTDGDSLMFSHSVSVRDPQDITLPSGHTGYKFKNSADQPYEIISAGAAPSAQNDNTDSQLPDTTALLPNFPNPFNPETWIPYHLSKPSNVFITIYDIQGNVVRHLDLGQQPAGYYTDRSRAAHWNGLNAVGERVANGIYFYQLKAGEYTYLRKMLILK